ncbi:MAG: hypothetical protein AAFQ21_15375 [Pseudomonadota bacterium]
MSQLWRIATPGAGAIHTINGGIHCELLEPNLDRRPAVLDADVTDHVGEVFLNASIASGFWA